MGELKRRSLLMVLLILMGLVAIPVRAAEVTVTAAEHPTLGKILTGPTGMTLYMFTKDEPGVSNCYDTCAANWPPLLLNAGEQPTLQSGLSGVLGTTTRKDGSIQVTYNQQPLYYWVRDKVAGDATGQNVNGVWFVVNTEPTVQVAQHAEHGSILTGANGMTLYVFTRDTAGVSNCYDTCATNWPPLLLKEGRQLTASAGLDGQLGTVTRKDGAVQVTYNGMPLYYWLRDKAAGDTTGHKVNNVWFVAQHGLLLDLAGHWSQGSVTAAVRTGWVTGHPDGTFKPEGLVTRAELAKMLTSAYRLPAKSGSTFTDTANHWAAEAIETAVAAGAIKPSEYASGQFEPDRPLTRAEVAAMIVRTMGKEADAAQSAAAVGRFADGGQIAASFRGFLGFAVEKGIVAGYEDNTLQADRLVTRAEAVVMIQRALNSK